MLERILNQRTRRSLWIALGFFCCALVVFGSLVQVAHTHTDGQAVHNDCALCHTAHVVVQPSVPQSLPNIVRTSMTVSVALQPIRPTRFFVFSLFTRPPPDQTALT